MISGIRFFLRKAIELAVFIGVTLGFCYFLVNIYPQARDAEVLQAVLHELKVLRNAILGGFTPWFLFALWTCFIAFIFYVLGMFHVTHVWYGRERNMYRTIIKQQMQEKRILKRERDGFCTAAHSHMAFEVQERGLTGQ